MADQKIACVDVRSASCCEISNEPRTLVRSISQEQTPCWAERPTQARQMMLELLKLASGEIKRTDAIARRAEILTSPPDLAHPTDRVWNIAITGPNAEKIATDWLKRRGFAAYAPEWLKTYTRRGVEVKTQRRLFPRYLFVGQEPGRSRFIEIENTMGVAAMVRVGGVPITIPEKLVAHIRDFELRGCFVQGSDGLAHLVPPGCTLEETELLQAGRGVRIADGQFTGFLGRVIAAPEKDRVRVLVELFGRMTSIELQTSDVEAQQEAA